MNKCICIPPRKQNSPPENSFVSIDSLDFEESKAIKNGLRELLNKLSQPYEQEKFSLKFKDPILEQDYQKQQHQQINNFSFIYLLELFVVMIYYNYRWAWMISVALYVVAVIQYFLGKKYYFISLNLAPVQSIMVFVSIFQLGIVGNPSFAQVDLFQVITGLIATLSFFSYCQKSLFWTYLICILFLLIRTWFWIPENFRYFRFNLFYITCFVFIYIFSRQFVSKERERFKRRQNQKQLLKMFHNLIRTHHDGIIISQNQDILFHNQQIDKIFDQKLIDDQIPANPENIVRNELQPIIKHKELIKSSLKLAIYKQEKRQNQQIAPTEEDSSYYMMNLWEFIMNQNQNRRESQKINDSFIRRSRLEEGNPLADGGVFFKYKIYGDSDEAQTKKKLQVYSTSISTGDRKIIMTTIRDMSFWLDYQKEKNMSQMKTLAFASAAHEFRNPLNAITASLDLLTNYVSQDRAQTYLRTAKNSSNLMLYLVNDILDFSQLESKNLLLNLKQTNIQDTMNEVSGILGFKAQYKNILLEHVISEFVPCTFVSDHNRLKQILINLISNGIKYTIKGSVKIFIDYESQLKHIKFQVKDTGVGISHDQYGKLFSAFTKIMKDRDLNQEGVGLGLQVSRNLANALGGEISFESQVGVGSNFTLALPCTQSIEEFEMHINQHRVQEFIRSKSLKFEGYRSNQNQLNLSLKEVSHNKESISQDKSNFSDEQREAYNGQDSHDHELNHNFSQYQFNKIKRKSRINWSLNKESENTQYDFSFTEQDNLKSTNRKLLLQNSANNKQDENTEMNIDFESQQQQQQPIVKKQRTKKQKDPAKTEYLKCKCSKILIVDDEPFNLIALEGLLNQLEIEDIDKSYNGLEAITKIQANSTNKCRSNNHQGYQLIITDNQMPVMNGLEMARQIQEICEKDLKLKRNKPFIVLLSGDSIDVKNELRKNFNDIILKPVNVQKLKEIVQKYYYQ
ncbi:periplasmic sensor hybrid histidine kinase [Stylonychia lemnae]|uniref:Periplasmic sensor hybrid histidine kinase n=1 Tax=Stylonychia lemnae TaxID=5949 RepID=A0A078B9K4_STYLE|nr:periplasmic sensor hybrid histidine kinase [Stylonychia lemnae]|eukprot:CDW91215.1 periplasmic sensor hybrid histidine kinase [Stylonychia lemnae]